MILPGGTFANLQGLLLARRAHFPQWHTEGPTALTGRPLLYSSDVSHFCNHRAGQVIGIGEQGLVRIPSCGRGEIDVDRLEKQITLDRQAGHLPFAVVANGGTTGTGALDDIGAIAEICQRHDLWLHVDACYGGGALLVEPKIPQLQSIHRADSIAIDPHKWFFIPMTAGLLLTRHRQLELQTFDVSAPYIPSDGTIDAFRRGLPTSRRSSGLTIWMTLRRRLERDSRSGRAKHQINTLSGRPAAGGRFSRTRAWPALGRLCTLGTSRRRSSGSRRIAETHHAVGRGQRSSLVQHRNT